MSSLLIGIDWSQAKHDICFLNEAGAALARLTIAHSADGFARLEAQRAKLGFKPSECCVALETAHNLLVDFLWGHGYDQVYVIPPSVVTPAPAVRVQASTECVKGFWTLRLKV
jgi:hypothetical protein